MRSHSAGVRAAVPLEDALVVLRRGKRQSRLAVGQHQERGLLALEKFLDDNSLARHTEDPFFEEKPEGPFGLRLRIDDDDALARGQAIGLQDGRQSDRLERDARLVQRGRHRRAGGGNAMPATELFAVDLRCLDFGGEAARSEDRKVSLLELVDDSECQGQLRTDDGEVDRDALGEIRELDDRGRGNRNEIGDAGDPGIAGSREQFRHARAFANRARQRVFPRPGSNDENLHAAPLKSTGKFT